MDVGEVNLDHVGLGSLDRVVQAIEVGVSAPRAFKITGRPGGAPAESR